METQHKEIHTISLDRRTYMDLFPLFVGPYYDAIEEIFGVDF